MTETSSSRAALPSVDRLLRHAALAPWLARAGRPLLADEIRRCLDAARAADAPISGADALAARIDASLTALFQPSLRPVFNLTGTVIHTNLGRAVLPAEAIAAVAAVAGGASTLEFDVARGRRGDRDDHIEAWLCRLTGAEAATVVNNNAAAVLLLLNTLANRKRVPVSRGELIEIGGAFRMPDIMARAGARLVEVGTTNRTHLRDFEAAIDDRTGLLLKVHTSNYAVEGFTAMPSEAELAELAHRHGLPFAVDLGSGSLIDLAALGLPHEPTPAETLAAGADLVTFSGDKLLGGPQAGLIVGRADLVRRLKRNPLKRALRCDKMTLAALAAVLPLHANPAIARTAIPSLRWLARPLDEIDATARQALTALRARLDASWKLDLADTRSQIGSGALPVDLLPSRAVTIAPDLPKRRRGAALGRLAAALRALPVPVLGRIEDGRLLLDMRTLDDSDAFAAQLDGLSP